MHIQTHNAIRIEWGRIEFHQMLKEHNRAVDRLFVFLRLRKCVCWVLWSERNCVALNALRRRCTTTCIYIHCLAQGTKTAARLKPTLELSSSAHTHTYLRIQPRYSTMNEGKYNNNNWICWLWVSFMLCACVWVCFRFIFLSAAEIGV